MADNNGGAAWDFTADSLEQEEVSKKLIDDSTQFTKNTDEMYKSIDRMAAFWEGTAQTAFHDATYSYKGAIADLGKSINMYGQHFAIMAPGTEQLATDILAILADLAGAGGNPANNPTGDPNFDPNGASEDQEDESKKQDSEKDKTKENEQKQDSEKDKSDENGNKKASDDEEKSEGKVKEEEKQGELETESEEEAKPYAQVHSLDSGTPVTIDGENYNVYGFVRGKDGKSQAIYVGKDNYLYYFDENGKKQHVQQKMSDPTFKNLGEDIEAYTKTRDAKLNTDGTLYTESNVMIEGRPYALSLGKVEFSPSDVFKTGVAYEDLTVRSLGAYGSYDISGHREFTDDYMFNQINEMESEDFYTIDERQYTNLNAAKHGDTVETADHTGTPTLCVPSNEAVFISGVQNKEVIKLTENHSINTPDGRIYGGQLIDLSSLNLKKLPFGYKLTDEFYPQYLVYNDGYYYLADNYGNILESEKYKFPVVGPLTVNGITNIFDFK